MRHEKVDLIFKAAIEVFAESGFDQAKMDDIAKAAGVAKGTIYYHFKSKEELFVGLMNEGVQKLIDSAQRNVDLHESPTDQLLALVENQVHFYCKTENWRSCCRAKRSERKQGNISSGLKLANI